MCVCASTGRFVYTSKSPNKHGRTELFMLLLLLKLIYCHVRDVAGDDDDGDVDVGHCLCSMTNAFRNTMAVYTCIYIYKSVAMFVCTLIMGNVFF